MQKNVVHYLVGIVVTAIVGFGHGLIWVCTSYGQDLAHSWSMDFGDGDRKEVRGITVDSAGNVLITGPANGTVDFGGGPLTSAGWADCYVAKFTSGGEHIWSRMFGDWLHQYGNSVAVDASDNIAVVGVFTGTLNFGGEPLTNTDLYDIFMVKFNSVGAHLWSRKADVSSQNSGVTGVVDGAGNLVIAGSFMGTANFGGVPFVSGGSFDVFVARYNMGGEHLWSRSFGGLLSEEVKGCVLDPGGNIVVIGAFEGTIDFGGGPLISTGYYDDLFIVKFDPNGSHIWSRSFGGTGGVYPKTVAVDESGNIVLTGSYSGTLDLGGGPLSDMGGGDVYVAKFDEEGAHLWSHGYGNSEYQTSTGIASDSAGNVFAIGYFLGALDFGGGPLTIADGTRDLYLVQFSADGNHLWSQRFGESRDQTYGEIAVNGTGGVFIGGELDGSVDFGGDVLDGDIYLAKFDYIVSDVPGGAIRSSLDVRVYPNPFNPQTTIEFEVPRREAVRLCVFDATGRLVKVVVDGVVYDQGRHRATWRGRDATDHHVASGTYFCRIETGYYTETKRITLLK